MHPLSFLSILLPRVGAAQLNADHPFHPSSASVSQWRGYSDTLGRKLCYVPPSTSPSHSDAFNIQMALNHDCAESSLVIFPGPVYHIDAPMNTTVLNDTWIYVLGTFEWTSNVTYWLQASMPVGFQNQSTVWYFGGEDVVLDGFGNGTLDGNGQTWYDWARDRSNLADRPMNINWRGLRNSVVRRLSFVQSQMWTMATTWSQNVLFEDIYVNNTSSSSHGTLNTDGVDTVYSDNITFRRWDVTCGDDAIALKGNSSNISVHDSIFRGGRGLAIGSLGQYRDEREYIYNFHARNLTMYDTRYGLYVKTWPGNQNGYPPNGGGGGTGHAYNITVEDVKLYGTRQAPLWLWQCEHYEGDMGKDCDSSEFSFSDLGFEHFEGTVAEGVTLAASFRCSEGGQGCSDISISNFEVRQPDGEELTDWWCSNTHGKEGFSCDPFPEKVELMAL